MLIAGFAKVRSEIIKEGNLYRALENLEAVCDGGIICDDASTDGTREYLRDWIATRPTWTLLGVLPEEQSFASEMRVKQTMMRLVDQMRPKWVWWLDGDEEIEKPHQFRDWVRAFDGPGAHFHYTQLWRNYSWARTDNGFDDGVFLKLWRHQPGLTFDTTPGTHRHQFPTQFLETFGSCPVAPFEIVHWGNYGKSLVWKAIQYSGGLGGVDRHIAFGHTQEESMATGKDYDEKKYSEPNPTYREVRPGKPPPEPFTLEEIRRIRSMGGLKDLNGWFTVVVPAHNRAGTLPKALDSLIAQTHEQWIALVLDDGSTDDTPDVMRVYQDKDPRIFYARYETNRGGVAMNEIGMTMACEMTEWWSRLGSDDWFGPRKLERDAAALEQYGATFGPFTVWKHGVADHVCAGSWGNASGTPSERLRRGEFLASWANVAVRCSVLKRVRERFGNFCDPRLRNMEDFLVNVRVAHVEEWAWRPGDDDDAFWNCLEGIGEAHESASANAAVTGQDSALTRQIIREMT